MWHLRLLTGMKLHHTYSKHAQANEMVVDLYSQINCRTEASYQCRFLLNSFKVTFGGFLTCNLKTLEMG